MGKFDYRKYISENKFSIGKVKSKNFENSTIINEDGRFIQDRKGPNFSDLAIKAKSLEDFIQQYKADEVGKNRFNSKQNFPNEKEFYKISQLDRVYLGHENNTLHGAPACAVVCPRKDNPNVLRFAKLWSPIIDVDTN